MKLVCGSGQTLELCGADKGAGTVTRVYYYTGDTAGLASLSQAELDAVAANAVLLWQRDS